MSVARDPILTPLVAQMAVFSAIDSTERSVGAATYAVHGHADFEGGSVKLDNVYSGDVNTATMASLGVATPLSYALTSGFDALRLKSVTLEIDADRDAQPDAALPTHSLRIRRAPERMWRSTWYSAAKAARRR